MRTTSYLVGVAGLLVLAAFPAVSSDEVPMPWELVNCDLVPEGVIHAEWEFLDPTDGSTVLVSALCQTDVVGSHLNTDCPSHSYTFWAGVQGSPLQYKYATSNDDGLSSTAVKSSWDAMNNLWDGRVSADIFGGSTLGGSGAAVGKNDGVNQVGFKNLGGRTLGIQYAWVSGGIIVQTDSGYNTLAALSISPDPNKYDLEGIAAQEFGHGYGLGHADTQCLTMYGSLGRGDYTKDTLGDGDIMGIQARYP